MAVWTNAGINLVASAVQTPGPNTAIGFVAVGTGCGTLASALTNGQPYTSLLLDAGLPANVAAGASLTITDGTNTQTVTVTGAGASAGATTIPVNSFNASASFAAHTTGVAPTPQATDTALYNEIVRVAATVGAAGASPGESLNSAYFDGTQPSNVYMQVGYFGGSTASATPGSGTLMVEDIQFWNHTLNADSASFQADTTI